MLTGAGRLNCDAVLRLGTKELNSNDILLSRTPQSKDKVSEELESYQDLKGQKIEEEGAFYTLRTYFLMKHHSDKNTGRCENESLTIKTHHILQMM